MRICSYRRGDVESASKAPTELAQALEQCLVTQNLPQSTHQYRREALFDEARLLRVHNCVPQLAAISHAYKKQKLNQTSHGIKASCQDSRSGTMISETISDVRLVCFSEVHM